MRRVWFGLTLCVLASSAKANAQPAPLLVFGGRDHKLFLGCLCAPSDSASVFHDVAYPYTLYGIRKRETSIFNPMSEVGLMLSEYSPCNHFAKDPPVIVTLEGQFIARLTVSSFVRAAATDTTVLEWLKDACEKTGAHP